MTVTIDHNKLRTIVAEICAHAGSTGDEPKLVADNLVTANLMGHDSHGVGMLHRYVSCSKEGEANLNAHAKIIVDNGAMIVVDGQAGLGQVIGGEAMDFGIERARQHGCAIVATRRSFHLGRIGAWAERCAEQGFVSMHHTNVVGQSPHVAPFGAREAKYSTNPYTVGIPATDDNPVTILDMATSVVAMGKVRVAKNKGEQVAPGTLVDADGNETTDPNVMYSEPRGAALPFGGHKGGGLALMNELLGGVLCGGHTMRPETNRPRDAILNNMLSIIIDPSKLIDNAFFTDELNATLAYVKGAKPIDPAKPVLVPGDPERMRKADREANGVPIDDNTWEEILACGDSVGFGRNRILDISGS
jgi:hydroxycarboxylate dehydrogenase B